MQSNNVRSETLGAQSRAALRGADLLQAATTLPWRLGGIGALIVGFGFWVIGARYTVLGAPRVIGLLLSQFGIALDIPLPVGWSMLWLTVGVGAVVSSIEFGCRPRRSFFAKSLLLGVAAVVLWLLFNGADWLSTFVAVTTPAPGSWSITRWLATTLPAAIIWSTFLTYCPELLMIAGGRWIINGRF